MRKNISVVLWAFLAASWVAGQVPQASQMPADYQEALSYLGKGGDFKEGVFKVNVPRNDLRITVQGVTVPTPFGFGGWLGMTKGDGGIDVMMGDMVLLQEEVNPVMSALLANGIEVTALHNHFFWEEPRLFYMHVHGMGKPLDLARRVKPGLDLIGRARPGAPEQPGPGNTVSEKAGGSPPSPQANLATPRLASIVGREGEKSGPVYKITLGREDIKMECMGARIGTRMGLNSWAAFFGSDESAVVAGDIAMLENEVTPVLKALRSHGLEIVAIHHHMTNVQPLIIFLHYWGKGPAAELASGFRAALDVLGQKKAPRP